VDLSAAGLAEVKTHAKDLAQQADAWLKNEQKFKGKASLQYSADMRYRGQSYEIEVPLEAAWIESGDLRAIGAAFHSEHERVYEHADEKAPVQIVNLRLVASGASPQPRLKRADLVPRKAVPVAETKVFYDGAHVDAGIYDRDKLSAGEWFAGPAIVRQSDCTTCLVGGFRATVDEFSNLIITRDTGGA
jgi:N-methylhydantoinase A